MTPAPSITARRVLAWTCVALVLLAVATPIGSPPAILAPAAPVFLQPLLAGFVPRPVRPAPRDPLTAAAVPARAPPLA